MYRIGEFSKIVDIPVRTLRFYDEVGVLSPSLVDDFTGYRYYNEDNVDECNKIKMLKSLDFSLEEISKYKNYLTSDILSNKEKEIELKIIILKEKQKRLKQLSDELNKKTKVLRRENI